MRTVSAGYEPGAPESRDLAIVALLEQRDGSLTEVRLHDGRCLAVWDVAIGYDAGDAWAHVTTNVSPGAPGAALDFFFTSDVESIWAPESGRRLLGPMPRTPDGGGVGPDVA